MSWPWPLKDREPLFPDEPGRFGFERAEDVHSGVDLYCELGTEVVAVEDGSVVAVEWFTGQHVLDPDGNPSSWWNDTQVVLVEGASGIVAYGEVSARVAPGDSVVAGQVVGVVDKAVLKSFKGRPMVMLHLELYGAKVPDDRGSLTTWWDKGTPKPPHLLDPTPLLGPGPEFDLAAYDGRSFCDPQAPRKASRWWSAWGGVP